METSGGLHGITAKRISGANGKFRMGNFIPMAAWRLAQAPFHSVVGWPGEPEFDAGVPPVQLAADAACSWPSGTLAVRHPWGEPLAGPRGARQGGTVLERGIEVCLLHCFGFGFSFQIPNYFKVEFSLCETYLGFFGFFSASCPCCKLMLIRPPLYVIFADRQVLHRLLQCVAVLWLLRLMCCQLGLECLWMPLNQFGLGATRSNVTLCDLVTFTSCSLLPVF